MRTITLLSFAATCCIMVMVESSRNVDVNAINRWTNLPLSSNIEDRRMESASYRIEVTFNDMEK